MPDGSLIHIEDFAQVFDVYPDDKYKAANMRNIARVIAAESDDDDIAELVRRMTFNTLIGNGDMHLKNWSLIYPDGKNAALAPAYDFVSTIPYIPNDSAALNVSRTKSFDSFSADNLPTSPPRRHCLKSSSSTRPVRRLPAFVRSGNRRRRICP